MRNAWTERCCRVSGDLGSSLAHEVCARGGAICKNKGKAEKQKPVPINLRNLRDRVDRVDRAVVDHHPGASVSTTRYLSHSYSPAAFASPRPIFSALPTMT